MRKIIEFLILFAGLYAGICLIFTGYSQWLATLIEYMNEPCASTALESIYWLVFAGTTTYLTGEMLK